MIPRIARTGSRSYGTRAIITSTSLARSAHAATAAELQGCRPNSVAPAGAGCWPAGTTIRDRRAASTLAHAFAHQQETQGLHRCTGRFLEPAWCPELRRPGFPAAAIPPQGKQSALDAPARSRPLHAMQLDRTRTRAADHSVLGAQVRSAR